MGNEKDNAFPTKEAAVWLASHAAFTEYMSIKMNIKDICPEAFLEGWINTHIFHVGEEFKDSIYSDFMDLCWNYRKRD